MTAMAPLDELAVAFAKVPYPGDARLSGCPCPECVNTVRVFRGQRWSRVSQIDWDETESFGEAVMKLSPLAYVYFLPGLLRFEIEGNDVGFPSVVARLKVAEGDTAPHAAQVFQLLSPKQRQAIAAVLATTSGPRSPSDLALLASLAAGEPIRYSRDAEKTWSEEQLRRLP